MANELYSIPNKGPTPKIDAEEGLPPGGLDIAWVEDYRKNEYHWSSGLPWYDRLHAHATLNSARRNVKCKRPFEPKDELDFVLESAYCPNMSVFAEKGDPYLQIETVLGHDMNIKLEKRKQAESLDIKLPKCEMPDTPLKETWRVLRNRVVVYPDKGSNSDGNGTGVFISNGGVLRRENIYHVKLGIAADHSPQTNPGYSRTPSGAFYSI